MIINSKICEAFLQFLEEHNCKEQYIKNMVSATKISKGIERDDNLLALFSSEWWGPNVDAANLVSGAFPWANTPEKYEYWNDLNTEWKLNVLPGLLP